MNKNRLPGPWPGQWIQCSGWPMELRWGNGRMKVEKGGWSQTVEDFEC